MDYHPAKGPLMVIDKKKEIKAALDGNGGTEIISSIPAQEEVG